MRIIRPEIFLETGYKPWYRFSGALHCFAGRCIVRCEGKGSGVFAVRCRCVATMREQITQLDVHLECRRIVGFGRGSEIGSKESLGEFRGAWASVRMLAASTRAGPLRRSAAMPDWRACDHLVRLIVALVEMAEIDVGFGSFSGCNGVA